MLDCTKCETVGILLGAGAWVDEKDRLGRTPFQVALERKNYGVMRELVKGGADINLEVNENCETYLHIAILNCEPPSVVKFLLDLGSDVNKKDMYGLRPIQKAALTGDKVLLELLSSEGAEMDVRDGNGWSLLHCAARYGHTAACGWLLSRGAHLEAKTDRGRTPLHFAAEQGHLEVVRLLLECGARLGSKDDTGWTPLRFASYRGHKAVVQAILDRSGGRKRPLRGCSLS